MIENIYQESLDIIVLTAHENVIYKRIEDLNRHTEEIRGDKGLSEKLTAILNFLTHNSLQLVSLQSMALSIPDLNDCLNQIIQYCNPLSDCPSNQGNWERIAAGNGWEATNPLDWQRIAFTNGYFPNI